MCLEKYEPSNVKCRTCEGTGLMWKKMDPQLDRRVGWSHGKIFYTECGQCRGSGYYSKGMFKPKQDVRTVLEPLGTGLACVGGC